MSQYQTGLVDITSGSATVSGTGTTWTTNVTVGDLFMVTGYSVQYQVASIPTDTSLTISPAWAGTTLTDQTYTITRDFTPNYDLPEIYPGDKNWAFNITVAFRMIDLALGGTTSTFDIEEHSSVATVSLTTSDLQTIHIIDSTSECIVYLPSIDSSDVGSWIIIRKGNSGNVRVVAADSDTIMDGSPEIDNAYSSESWASINLFVETSTTWGCYGMLGRWQTVSTSPSLSPSPSPSVSPSVSPS